MITIEKLAVVEVLLSFARWRHYFPKADLNKFSHDV